MRLLHRLAQHPQMARRIVVEGGREALESMSCPSDQLVAHLARGRIDMDPDLPKLALETLKLLPMEAPGLGKKQVKAEVNALEDEDEQCEAAEQLGTWAAMSDENRGVINRAGGVEALVALVVTGSDEARCHAARALRNLANHAEAKENILKADGIAVLTPLAKHGKGKVREAASEALKLLPMEVLGWQVKAEVNALENEDEQCKAAEQLGTWAATSDENRGVINRAGGVEALVALVVTGSDEARCHAARALRNLANHAEAKENILKADGIAVLTPLAKHGKGRVREAASEALNLLSVEAKAKPAPVADSTPAAEPSATEIPSGQGTRVAMFSARFDGGPMEVTLGRLLCHLSFAFLFLSYIF